MQLSEFRPGRLLALLAALLAPAAAGEFGPEFLDGRLVGGQAHDLLLIPWNSPDDGRFSSSARDLWRLGSADVFESRLWLRGGLRADGADEWRFGTAGWTGEIRPAEGTRVSWNWRMDNLWFAYDNGADDWRNGFDSDRSVELYQSFRVKRLGNDGKIQVEREDYGILFYRDPQLDAGQIGWEIVESHAFAKVGILADTVGAVLRYGLARPVEVGAEFLARRPVWRGKKEWIAGDWDGTGRLNAGFFSGPVRIKADGTFSLWDSETRPDGTRDLGVEGDLVLFGTRIFSEVSGNWDGYFDRTAPAGQIRLSGRAAAWAFDDLGSGPDSLRAEAQLGLPLGFAVDGGARFLGGLDDPAWGVGLAWSNAPLRLGDPKRHDPIEVLYGHRLPAWANMVAADFWDDGGEEGSRWVSGSWSAGLPWGWQLDAELALAADDGFDLGWGCAGIGWGSRHWRLSVGAQQRWKAGAGFSDAQPWRVAHDGTPAKGFHERTWGADANVAGAGGRGFAPGWGVMGAIKSWF